MQSTVLGSSENFTYSRLPYTELISGYTGDAGGSTTPLSVGRTYEENRSLVTTVTNKWNSNLISAFEYHNDDLSRRTNRIDTTPGFTHNNTFKYNLFSEVTNAYMNSVNHSYEYDPIGNRTLAKNGSDEIDYLVNGLNQYTAIDDDSQPAVVNPTYDDDGNMLTCTLPTGEWLFRWDGENRMTHAEQTTFTSQDSSGYRIRFVNDYDYMGRRIKKRVERRNVVEDMAYLPEDERWAKITLARQEFVYDGWNLIQDTFTNSTTVITNFYAWGIALSGSLQGAGGVGGLLAMTENDSGSLSTYYPVGDANGNITEYVDSSGSIAWHGEYDAFGNLTQSTG